MMPGTTPSSGRRSTLAGSALSACALLFAGCVTVVPAHPTDPPAPTQRVAIAPTPTPVPTTRAYRVRSGDNLHAIAQRFGLTIGQLLAANPDITDPNRITVGQTLIIPPPDAPDTGPNSASMGDAMDDAVDANGELVAAQGYADLTGLDAALISNRRLQIRMGLVNGPPPRMDPAVEVVTYTVFIDVDGDGQPNFSLVYSNDVDGQSGYAASLANRETGEVQAGASFPGTVTVKGDTITFVIRRSALGAPRAYALAATVERTYHPNGQGDPQVDDSIDHAPDQQWPRPNPRWLDVGGV